MESTVRTLASEFLPNALLRYKNKIKREHLVQAILNLRDVDLDTFFKRKT
jgi:hypothetical protein